MLRSNPVQLFAQTQFTFEKTLGYWPFRRRDTGKKMEDLLPYFERELVMLRRHCREFSERYPRIAGK
ncbi:MAG: type VI secretion system baseplate subunit TssF, partial [Janthinobacterium sp.]